MVVSTFIPGMNIIYKCMYINVHLSDIYIPVYFAISIDYNTYIPITQLIYRI